jgi:pseudaminic acid cytidylyltransferase
VSAVAIIPARGGSKRLPRKNVLDFLGRPIVAYTIDAAATSRCFDSVVVSTDDEEIAAVARYCGAAVDHRPVELATDTSTVVDVCLDFLDREAAAGRAWKVMACLYATAPLRNAEDVRETLALLLPDRCDFAMAVTTYDLPPHQALRLGADASLTPMWPELVTRRASDLPKLHVDNGSTYAVDVAEFRRHRSFYGPNLRGHDMPRQRSIDIDTQDDFDRALWSARRLGFGSPKVADGARQSMWSSASEDRDNAVGGRPA